MVNPCYDCPKYREYGQYLDEILISQGPLAPSEKKRVKKGVGISADECPLTEIDNRGNRRPVNTSDVIAQPVKPVRRKRLSAEDNTRTVCSMGGCDNYVANPGTQYCKSCRAVRSYYRRLGREVPDGLTDRQKAGRKAGKKKAAKKAVKK